MREKVGIEAPGQVVVREERGRLVIEPALTPAGFRRKWGRRLRKGPPLARILGEMERAERRRDAALRGRRSRAPR